MQMKNILTVIGTRPEAIKLIPLAIKLNDSRFLRNKICITRQHISLVDSLFTSNNIKVDYQFRPYKKNASLSESFAYMLLQFNNLLGVTKPDLIIVQGDTTTGLVAALAGFYAKIKVAHVEAGLRSGNLYSPWPEEAHRIIIDKISNYFFVPTEKAKTCLINEGVNDDKIWVVGNTSIDAIKVISENIKSNFDLSNKSIVVTLHRRENHGEPLINICNALKNIARNFPDVRINFCLHPNPSVHNKVKEILSGISNIKLLAALDHAEFVKLLTQCIFIITDSGGIQEESTFLGKPVLIARNVTERTELIEKGTGILVGTNTENIFKHSRMLLEDPILLSKMSKIRFSYGDGYASERIVKILEKIL